MCLLNGHLSAVYPLLNCIEVTRLLHALLMNYHACIIPLHNVLFLCTTYVFSIFENDIVPFRARKISMLGSRLAGMYRAYFIIISDVSLTHKPDQPTTCDTKRPEPFCCDLWNEKGSDRTTPGAQLQPRFIFHSTFCTVSRNQKSR